MTKKVTLTIRGREAEPLAEEVIDEALDTAAELDDGMVIVCRGGFLCLQPPDVDECPWCYRLHPEDEREGDEIARAIFRPTRH